MNLSGNNGEKLQPRPPRLALEALRDRPSDRIVLFMIGQRCDWWTGYLSPSVETVASWTGLSRRAVQKSITQLVRDGWLLPNGTREHGIREYFLALDGPERDAKALAVPGDSPDQEPEAWQIEEIVTWAQELEFHPAGADRAVIREWLASRYSRIVILGALRLGKLRRRYQGGGEPIRSLRYFDSVLADLAPEKPDDDVRIAYVKHMGLELGHRPALPPPPAVARRTYERIQEARRGLEAARSRSGRQLSTSPHQRGPAGSGPVPVHDAFAVLLGELAQGQRSKS